MQDLTWLQWDAKSVYRGINQKYSQSIEIALNCYGSKIPRLEKMLAEEKAKYTELLKILRADVATLDGLEEIANLTRKINRLKDKQVTCEKEIYGRNNGFIKRDPKEFHNTEYFLDLDGGNDGNTGLNTGQSWLTFARFTTTLVKSPGDYILIRANTDETMAADLAFDEDGDQDDYISLLGCDSVTNDPWSDGSDVKPILSFGDGSWQVNINTDHFYKFTRISFKDSSDANGVVYSNSDYPTFIGCEFRSGNSGSEGAYMSGAVSPYFEDCTFENNVDTIGAYVLEGFAKFVKCIFDGGNEGQDIGIRARYNSLIECVECLFGQSVAHDTDDVQTYGQAKIVLRACNITRAEVSVSLEGGAVFEEDADAVFGAWFATYYRGTIEKDTGEKDGNANFSFKMLPNANCGPNNELTLNNESIVEFPYVTSHPADVEVTLTVKIKACGTWGSYPTAPQLYMKTWYLDHAVDATRSVDVSTEVLSDGNWTSFTTTFTPLQAGLAYTEIRLGIFEDAGDGCYVNGEIVAS